MPTSATGRTEQRRGLGFTLIEVLLVLVILGITITLVAVNFARDTEAVLREETRRIAVLLQHARDEAIVTGRAVAWRADAAGYGFSVKERSRGWVPIQSEGALRVRPWPPQVSLVRLTIAGQAVATDSPLLFAPSGINLPFDLSLEAADRRRSVTGDAAGEIVPQE